MQIITWFAVLISIIALPLYLFGTYVGQAIYPLASEQTYRRLALVILTFIAVLTLWATF